MILRIIQAATVTLVLTSSLLSQDCIVDANGQKQGKCIEENTQTGTIKTVNYQDGQLDGPYDVKYKLTRNKPYVLERGFYKSGQLHGVVCRYDTKGRILMASNYKNDQLDGINMRYEKGRLSIIERYENGRAQGLWEVYGKDGRPISYFYCDKGIFGPVHHLNKNGGVEKIVQRRKSS